MRRRADGLLIIGMAILLGVGVLGVVQGYLLKTEVVANRYAIVQTRREAERSLALLNNGFREEVRQRLANIEATQRACQPPAAP
jgi:hypothetical protein